MVNLTFTSLLLLSILVTDQHLIHIDFKLCLQTINIPSLLLAYQSIALYFKPFLNKIKLTYIFQIHTTFDNNVKNNNTQSEFKSLNKIFFKFKQ